MATNHYHSRYRETQLLTLLMACVMPQYLSLGNGFWWLFIIIGIVMILLYRQPEIYGRKGLKGAIIAAQLANFFGGIFFYFLDSYRSEITIVVGVFCLVYPLRKMLMLSIAINKGKKLNINEKGK